MGLSSLTFFRWPLVIISAPRISHRTRDRAARLDALKIEGPGSCSASDLVIATADQLQQAEAMAERIGEDGKEAPGVLLNSTFQNRASRHCTRHRDLDVLDDDIDVHRSPVTLVVAGGRRAGRRL